MIKRFIILLLIFQAKTFFAQEIPIGSWQDHLSYSDAVSVTEGNGQIYCATKSAIFIYDKTDFTIERLNEVSGLSDIGISKIKYNKHNNKFIIAYLNGNIDIIDENRAISNLSFIKNSNVIGDKIINHIYLKGKLAYLSTGFGIVVLDTDKLEIVDTYLFGPLGSFVVTNAVTIDSLNIYAATAQGLFYANKYSTNLADYNSWSKLPELGSSNYKDIVNINNRLIVGLNSSAWNADSVLYIDNSGAWQKLNVAGLDIRGLSTFNNNLIITKSSSIDIYDASLIKTETLFTVNNDFSILPKETIIDIDGTVWYAENAHGLIKSKSNYDNEIILPEGPSSSSVYNMAFNDQDLWVVSGGQNVFFRNNLVNHKSKDEWINMGKTIYNTNGNIAFDMVSVAINPTNPSNVFTGSWSSGLFEYNNNSISNNSNAQNSLLDSTFFGTTVCSALSFDKTGNLWVMSSFTEKILAVKTSDNNWHNYSFPGMTNTTEYFPEIIIDQNDYKWIISPIKNNIIVFYENGTFGDQSDDQITTIENIPGAKIGSIVEDLDGEIWIGTDEGIGVFYSPSKVFDEKIEAERVYIQQDGQTQILLETEIVTVIKVDGANRKWIGTQNSGVFLMSEDGTEQIEHFTKENSPLFSNNIFDIEINPKTGEVFFGTEKGLLSYKGTATDADDDFNDVFVYPNPVKPGYTGVIAVRGLVKDTDVRITDISGNIVYQTKSLGGQAIWDGKDFNGNKVQTGVYMIFNGSPEGELKAVAKIVFIH